MKIAAVTDDAKKISAHFGRATKYAVFTVEDGRIVGYELRDKVGHREFQQEGPHVHGQHDHAHGHGMGRHSAGKHRRMFEAIPDCQILLARGMGQGAYNGLQEIGIRPILTDIAEIETAVTAVIDDSIEDYPERLH